VTSKPKATKPPPEVTALASPPDAEGRQLIVLSVGRETDAYDCKPFPADFGPAFRVLKLTNRKKDEGDYAVSLHGHCSCSCPGHTYHGYCRHVAAMLLLWSRGELCTVHHPKAILARRAGPKEEK
jgi:hypothetical protein